MDKNIIEQESSEVPGTLMLSVNTLLNTLIADVYDGDGNLAQRFMLSPAQTVQLIKTLYPQSVLTQNEMNDFINKSWQFLR